MNISIQEVLSEAYKIAVGSYNLQGILTIAELMTTNGIKELKGKDH